MKITDIRPEADVPRLLERLEARAAPAPTRRPAQSRHRRKDGTLIDVEVRAHELTFEGRRAMLVVAQDITEQKRSAEALRQSEERYRTLVELSPDAIAIHSQGMVVFANSAGVKLLGATSSVEIIGRSTLDFVHPDSRPSVIARMRRLDRGESGALRGGEVRAPRRPRDPRRGRGRALHLPRRPRRAGGHPRHQRPQAGGERCRPRSTASPSSRRRWRTCRRSTGRSTAWWASSCTPRTSTWRCVDEETGLLNFEYFVDEVDDRPPAVKRGKTLTEYVLRTGEPLLVNPAVQAALEAQGRSRARGRGVAGLARRAPEARRPGLRRDRGPELRGVGPLHGDRPRDPHLRVPARRHRPRPQAGRGRAAGERGALPHPRGDGAVRDHHLPGRALPLREPRRGLDHRVGPRRSSRGRSSGTSSIPTSSTSCAGRAAAASAASTPRPATSSRSSAATARSAGSTSRPAPSSTAGRPAALGIAFDVTERKRAEEQIKELAYHDALTGLPNRLLFNDRLSVAVAQAHRSASRLAILFLDLDRFKVINDSLGHSLGDRLLQEVAERLQAGVRQGDTVARLGGDEFILLLPGIGRAEDAAKVAEKILETPEVPRSPRGPGAVRHRQHRDQPLPRGRVRRGEPDQERRHRDVPGQGAGTRQLPALHPRHERDRGGAAGAGEQPAQGASRRPARPALPAAARPRPPARCTAWRRCCAGTTPSADWCSPPSS